MTTSAKNGRPRAPRVSPEILDSAPPEAAEAERGLIGWMVFNSEFPSEAAEIGPWHFRDPVKGRIWKHALELHTAGIEIRPTTLAPHFKDGEFPADALYSWSQEAPTLRPTLAHYIKQILAAANRRRARHLGEELLRQSADASFDPENFRIQFDEAFSERKATEPIFHLISARELDRETLVVQFHARQVVPRLVPTFTGAAFKTFKTLINIDLAVSVASGTPFLNHFETTPGNVVYFSGEGGKVVLQEYARRIAASKGLALSEIDRLWFSEKLPKFNDPAHLSELPRILRDVEAGLVFFDPIYLAGSSGREESSFAQGDLYQRLGDIVLSEGATPTLLHHNKRNSTVMGQPAELSDLSWAGAAEYAGSWLLLSRRERDDPQRPGEYKLWLNAGNRFGCGGLFALDICEGRFSDAGGRYWKVDVLSADDARKQITSNQELKRQQASQETLETNKKRLLKVLAKYPDGETQRIIRDMSGLHPGPFKATLAALLEDGCVEACDIQKSNRKMPYEGYKIKESDPL
ncbi:MAG: AAA family ATPase [Pirellulales bacterium]|nr:AAA family ATPase [Pirellulales bacterium]